MMTSHAPAGIGSFDRALAFHSAALGEPDGDRLPVGFRRQELPR